MKKSLAWIVSFLLLISCAVLVWFSCTACSSDTQKTKPPKDVTLAREEVLRRTLDNTFDLDKVVVNISGTQGAKNPFGAKLSAVQRSGDYDYMFESMTDDSYVLRSAKIDGSVYEHAPGREDNVFTVKAASDSDLPALGEIKNEIKEFLAEETYGVITSNDGLFNFTFESTFGEELHKAVEFIADGKGRQAGEYIASAIGKDYTRAGLVADIKEIFADNVTVGAMMRGIDGMLSHAGSDLTAKEIVNELCDEADITTVDVYYMLEGRIRPPKKDETVYDYLLFGSGLAIIPADTLLSRLDKVSPELERFSQLRTRDIREKLVSIIDDDDLTFDGLYDSYFAAYVSAALAKYLPTGISLDFATVEKLRIGKVTLRIDLTVDAKEFLPRTVDISVSTDYRGLDMSAPDIIKIGTDLTAALSFDYNSSVNIKLPADSVIA